MKPTKEEFELLRKLVHESCGIVIKDEKEYLIIQRLGPLAREAGCNSFGEFYRLLKSLKSDPKFRVKVIEAITTNETSFFRDIHPFEAFKNKILPELIKHLKVQKEKIPYSDPKIRIWSSASSTGQEAYTVAMIIDSYFRSGNHVTITRGDFKILATDIASDILAKAMSGEYNQIEISRGLPAEFKERYFRKEENVWCINDDIRGMVEFRQVNLIKPFTMIGNFELIFCRNVLIYFDDATKTRILNQFYDMLSTGGFLILGAMENTYCLTDKFKSERIGKTIIYRKI